MDNNIFSDDVNFRPFISTSADFARETLDVQIPGNTNSFFRERSTLQDQFPDKSFIDQSGCCENKLPDNNG